MREIKCPRCTENIEISDASTVVRCPACLEEFKVNRPSAMSEQVTNFREQIARQDAEAVSPLRVKRRKPESKRPAQPPANDPPPAAPSPVVVAPAPVAPPTYQQPAHLAAIARRKAAAARRRMWAIAGLILLVLIVPLAAGTVWYYRNRKPQVIGPETPPAKSNVNLQDESSPPDEPRSVTSRPPSTRDPDDESSSSMGEPSRRSPDNESATLPAPSPPGQEDVTVNPIDRIEEHPNDPTNGFATTQVISGERRVIRRATVVAQFFDREGTKIHDDLRQDVRWLAPNGAARVTFEIVGRRISSIEEVRVEVVRPVEFAGDDFRSLDIESGSVRIIGGVDDEPMQVTGRVVNSTGRDVLNVRVWIEVYTHLGHMGWAAEIVPDRASIRQGGDETFTVKLPDDAFVDARGLKPVVRAVGQISQ